MRGLIFLAVLIAVINAQDDSTQINVKGCGRRPFARPTNDKIVGGQEAIVGDWGWQVALYKNDRFSCGGSIVNSRWVLTAAHCVHGATNPFFYTILVGAHNRVNIESWGTRRQVSNVIVHPNYSQFSKQNDIALMKLSAPVDYSDYIIPVCIDDGSIDFTGVSTWASGWGSLSSGSSNVPSILYDVEMTVLSSKRCQEKYPRSNSNVEVCAGDNENKDTCQGDSGGPLVVKNPNNGLWYSHGVTSYGRGCGDGGVYARTSAFKSWIQRIIESN